MFWNQEVETLSRADMTVWQNHKVNKVIERVYEKSLLYSKRMEEHGLRPEDIQTVGDLAKLPFTNRQDIADNYPYGLLTIPVSGVSYIYANQDANHKPAAISYTRNDMVMWTEIMSRMLVAGGINVTSVFQLAVAGRQYPACLGVHYGARQVGAALVPSDGDNLSHQIVLMQDFGVTGLFSTTEYILELAKEMKQAGIDPKDLPLQAIFCGIQSVTAEASAQIQGEYGVQALEIYGFGSVFGMGIGGECHHADGLHIQEDCFYPEVVHPVDGQVLTAGQRGELVLTSLTLEAIPLLRYRTGRQGYLDYGQCACGRTLVRLKK